MTTHESVPRRIATATGMSFAALGAVLLIATVLLIAYILVGGTLSLLWNWL